MCVLAALGPGRTSVGSAISIAGNVCPSTGCVGAASRAPRLRSCATCVLAAPGSGSRLGRLDESDRKTRVTGHKRCGCQPCREAGGCVPFARELSVAERRPSFPNAKTPVLGDVYASRARVRIPFRADWGQRSQDTVVRPRAAWEPDLPRSVRLSFTGSELRRPGERRFRQSRAAGVRMWTLGSSPG